MQRILLLATVASIGGLGFAPNLAVGVELFLEDFDSLPLGANVEEPLAGTAVWTATPPFGWTVDRSGVPGDTNPPNDNGVTEWIGWTFADRDWWIAAAGDQQRSEFVNASGAVLVADPDEWDDQPHPAGTYNTSITSPAISLNGVAPSAVSVRFDSSWRPFADQTGTLTVSYDAGAPQEVLRFASQPGPDFKPDATNEALVLPLNNPAGADSMALTWTLANAGNDWWWAIDNISVTVGDPFLSLIIDRDKGSITLENNTQEPRTMTGYSITSNNGALDRSRWLSVAENYDMPHAASPNPGDGSVDPNDVWFEFGSSTSHDLTEGTLGVATIATEQSIPLGMGSWVQYPQEDVVFEYVDASGSTVQGLVTYVGNGAQPFGFGDLNFDAALDVGDWIVFKNEIGADLTGRSTAQAYQLSDLDGDAMHGIGDFVLFRQAYDAANGAGAFAAVMAALPEPSSVSLVMMGLVSLLPLAVRRRWYATGRVYD